MKRKSKYRGNRKYKETQKLEWKRTNLIVGRSIHHLTIINKYKNKRGGGAKYKVICNCGNTRLLSAQEINSIKSCGKCDLTKAYTRYINKKIGTFTVKSKFSSEKEAKWKCECKCGYTLITKLRKLRKRKSCPNCRWNYLINEKIGSRTILTVLSPIQTGGVTMCRCSCDCGTVSHCTLSSILKRDALSCGCLMKTRVEHTKKLRSKLNLDWEKAFFLINKVQKLTNVKEIQNV
jgi:hypothetical protein